MPRASVIARAPRFPTVPDLIRLKKIWTVSVSALNYQLHAIGMLTDWQYRTLCIQIAKAGFRIKEPNENPRETSQLLPLMFSALYEEGVSRSQVARMLGVPQAELEQLMFGLTLTGIDGHGHRQKSHSRLTVVPKE